MRNMFWFQRCILIVRLTFIVSGTVDIARRNVANAGATRRDTTDDNMVAFYLLSYFEKSLSSVSMNQGEKY